MEIAYAVRGSGTREIVFVPGLLSHLDLNEEMPFYRPYLDRLPSLGRTVFFDRRGCGLSERSIGATLEEEVDDVRAVMDAAGIRHATVIGTLDGGAVAMLLAAVEPERVDSLVLYSTAARLLCSDEYPIGLDAEAFEGLMRTCEETWGSGFVWRGLISGAPTNSRTDELFARWERNSGTPRFAAGRYRLWPRWDVRPALDLITCPALVLYNRGNPIMSPDASKYLATHISGAKLVELPFDCHLTWDGTSMDAACDAIADFLEGTYMSVPTRDRVLATVMFTDVVESTSTAAGVGDQRWARMIENLESTTALIAERFGGRVVKGTGDGTLALFDAPGRALRAAMQLRELTQRVGLSLRIGIHTGEVVLRTGDVTGIAVHTSARVQALADPDEILVTRTVVDLIAGSGIDLDDRGEHELKGIPGSWRLYAPKP